MPWIPTSSRNWKRPDSSTQSGQSRTPPKINPVGGGLAGGRFSFSNFDLSIEAHNKNEPKDDLKNAGAVLTSTVSNTVLRQSQAMYWSLPKGRRPKLRSRTKSPTLSRVGLLMVPLATSTSRRLLLPSSITPQSPRFPHRL